MKKVGKKIAATCASITFFDDKIWFAEMECNELYYYDLKNKQTEFFCKFNDEKEYGYYLFSDILHYKNDLFVIPSTAANIYRINLKNREIKKIPLNIDEKVKSVSAQIWDGKIYLIGAMVPLIIEYNCENNELIYISDELNFMYQDNIFSTSIFVRKTLLINEKIYIPLCRKNYIGIFDLKKRKMTYQEVGSRRCGYSSICGDDGEHFWLAPRDKGPVVYWEKNTGKWEEIDFPSNYIPLESSFADMIFFNGNAWAFPLEAEGIWKVGCKENKINLFEKISKEENKMHIFCANEKLFCVSEKGNHLYVISGQNEDIESFEIFLPKENVSYHQKNYYEIKINSAFYQNEEYYRNKKILWEEIDTKLEYYLLWTEELHNGKKSGIHTRQSGYNIFSQIKS